MEPRDGNRATLIIVAVMVMAAPVAWSLGHLVPGTTPDPDPQWAVASELPPPGSGMTRGEYDIGSSTPRVVPPEPTEIEWRIGGALIPTTSNTLGALDVIPVEPSLWDTDLYIYGPAYDATRVVVFDHDPTHRWRQVVIPSSSAQEIIVDGMRIAQSDYPETTFGADVDRGVTYLTAYCIERDDYDTQPAATFVDEHCLRARVEFHAEDVEARIVDGRLVVDVYLQDAGR